MTLTPTLALALAYPLRRRPRLTLALTYRLPRRLADQKPQARRLRILVGVGVTVRDGVGVRVRVGVGLGLGLGLGLAVQHLRPLHVELEGSGAETEARGEVVQRRLRSTCPV